MSIVQAARDHLEHALHVLGSALVSRGMIYPFQGIIYLIAHPSLHKAVYPVFWRLILTSVVIGVGLLLTLPIQSAFVFFLGPLAPIVAFLLILAEFCVAALVVSRVLFGAIQDSLFDAVLLQQGLLPDPVISLQKAEALGLRLKGINARAGLKTRESLIEKARKRINMNALIRFIVSIPLNAVPVLGTVLFLAYNGSRSGPTAHHRYFQIKGYSEAQVAAYVKQHEGAYTAFGISSLLLDMIPVVGIFFSLTSSVGAALWACDMEKKGSEPPISVTETSEATEPAKETGTIVLGE